MFDFQDEENGFRLRVIDQPSGDTSMIERVKWTSGEATESLWLIETGQGERTAFIQHGLNGDVPEFFDKPDCEYLLLMIGGMGYVISKCSGSVESIHSGDGYIYFEKPLAFGENRLLLTDSRTVISVDLHTGSFVCVLDMDGAHIDSMEVQGESLTVNTSEGTTASIHLDAMGRMHKPPRYLLEVVKEIGLIPSLHDAWLTGFALDGESRTLYLKFSYIYMIEDSEEDEYVDSIVRIMIVLASNASIRIADFDCYRCDFPRTSNGRGKLRIHWRSGSVTEIDCREVHVDLQVVEPDDSRSEFFDSVDISVVTRTYSSE